MSQNRRKSVVVIGGGIAGLSAALFLVSEDFYVIVLEESDRFGGQILTSPLKASTEGGGTTTALIEEGAEGWVARSDMYPLLCEKVNQKIISQKNLADCEVSLQTGVVVLTELKTGEAARKLGFQVPASDRGRGIKAPEGGMGALIDAMVEELQKNSVDIRLNASVTKVHRDEPGSQITCEVQLKDGSKEFHFFDVVICCTSPEIAAEIMDIPFDLKRTWNSHVSVHLLGDFEEAKDSLEDAMVEREGRSSLRSVTIAAEDQKKLLNLRAISVVNEKFENRINGGGEKTKLLRFYFRGLEVVQEMEGEKIDKFCLDVLHEIFGVKMVGSYASHVSVWEDTLPEFPENFLEAVEKWKKEVNVKFGAGIWFAGSAFEGAGLHVAASSGLVAARAVAESFRVPCAPCLVPSELP